ncbi:MAG: VOC family protein, partial [Thermoproteota archaeon]|nr:VOC family protein [Thermoproteota archaeon]
MIHTGTYQRTDEVASPPSHGTESEQLRNGSHNTDKGNSNELVGTLTYEDMKVYRISAVTLKVKNMKKSCSVYSKIPGFRLTFGGKPSDSFTTFKIGSGRSNASYLNLELMDYDGTTNDSNNKKPDLVKMKGNKDFGRIIFHVENVDELYS